MGLTEHEKYQYCIFVLKKNWKIFSAQEKINYSGLFHTEINMHGISDKIWEKAYKICKDNEYLT